MATVIGVRFKKAGKVYYFDPCDFWPKPGQNVIVETARGIEFGEVVTAARSVSDEQLVSPLKKVIRIATPEDEQRAEYNAKREVEAFAVCQEKVEKHKLEMKLVSVEYTFDNSKIIFYFTANGRVDFRELVKDLASVFKMRIELRQIGVRDEAKMLGGLGSCGRPICCGAFLGDFQPVSIKMAKEQNLSLNPTKISGQCGRLMCCLKYEQDTYEQTLKRVPRVGKDIVTPDGVGVIVEINAIREKVKVRIRTGDDDSFELREYSMDDVRKPGPNDQPAAREMPKPQEKRQPQKKTPVPEESEAPAEENEGEENKRKRYPHQKAPKNLSTEQFLEKMHANEEEAGEPEAENGEQQREHKRRRRGGRGRHRDGRREEGRANAEKAPENKE
ncbi:MAG: stage 0 sporulation family protein [Clostridia bacterium]|nr:stage 0 sporulation family protein [Clostridia bacterium]